MKLSTFLLVFGWPVLSAVLNQLLAFKSAEEWQTFAERSPRGAAAIKLLRKVGLDLPGALRLATPFLSKFGFKGVK